MTDIPAAFTDSYEHLRDLADRYLRRAPTGSTLQATALVHEVYLKFVQNSASFADNAHLICTAAVAMRQILVDHARTRHRDKRGGHTPHVTLSAVDDLPWRAGQEIDLLVLHDALERLEGWDRRQAQVVELRFFAGLSVAEVAQVLGVSEKTVKRDWAMARAWLQTQLA